MGIISPFCWFLLNICSQTSLYETIIFNITGKAQRGQGKTLQLSKNRKKRKTLWRILRLWTANSKGSVRFPGRNGRLMGQCRWRGSRRPATRKHCKSGACCAPLLSWAPPDLASSLPWPPSWLPYSFSSLNQCAQGLRAPVPLSNWDPSVWASCY